MTVIKKSMNIHTERECHKRHVTCQFCVRAVRAEIEIEHLKMCSRFPLTCPLDCGEKVKLFHLIILFFYIIIFLDDSPGEY